MWFLAYFLLHLFIYALIRAEFLIWNWQSLKSLSHFDIFLAFLHGARFDLSVLGVTLGLFLLGVPWISKYRLPMKIWFWFFTALNSVLYILNFGDAELFNFTAKRFSVSTLYLLGEGGVGHLLWPYIPLVSCCTLIFATYIYFSVKLNQSYQNYNFSLKNKILLSFATIVISVLAVRGGFQLKPLTYVDAKIFDNSYANNLVLNSSFTLIKSIGKNTLQRDHYFSQDEMLGYLNAQDISPASVDAKKLNIVIIILESFSKEYTDLQNPEATPFLNSLKTQGLDFKKTYANGRRSVEGVAAILSGIPALMEEPFINSEFSANQIIGLGTLLQAQNYHTSFFHGAENGSMHFDRFTKSVGIENYYGGNEYPDKNDKDGTWGIYDEPFLKWACTKYGEFKSPFFSAVFTLSSHQPYKLPEQYREKFKDNRHDILKSVMYTDHSLKEFMTCAQQQTWYKDTLFIFTADHTGPALDEKSDFASRYQIPLILFTPNQQVLKNIEPEQYAQQIDILPTILDILKIEYKNKNYLSRSLLRAGPKVIALYSDRQYELVGDVKNKDLQLKAIQQYFSEGLYDNRLYYPAK